MSIGVNLLICLRQCLLYQLCAEYSSSSDNCQLLPLLRYLPAGVSARASARFKKLS